MILVLGGTTEARQLAGYLQEEGFPVVLTTVSSYGEKLAKEQGVKEVLVGALTGAQLADLIRRLQVRAVIDATHPFAENIRAIAQSTARQLGIAYGRLERAAGGLPEHPLLFQVSGYLAAACQAAALGDTIFLTIGSRRLPLFTTHPALAGKRIIARVLPAAEVLGQCRRLGLPPRQIVAMQGPFDTEGNAWMFRHFGAEVVVTKDSGPTGGLQAKWEACLALNIPLVVIRRPPAGHANVFTQFEEIKYFLKEVNQYGEGDHLAGARQPGPG
ncbi:MAG TPA: precorrin-6A reductase [Clostridia bacterium]|nr:precorrin-6A reductase [Clostridia bacterium]